MEAEKPGDTLRDVEVRALANTLAEVEAKTVGKTLGDMEAEALVDTPPETLSHWTKKMDLLG